MVTPVFRRPLMLFPMPPGVSAMALPILPLIPRGVPCDIFGTKKEEGNEFCENVS